MDNISCGNSFSCKNSLMETVSRPTITDPEAVCMQCGDGSTTDSRRDGIGFVDVGESLSFTVPLNVPSRGTGHTYDSVGG